MKVTLISITPNPEAVISAAAAVCYDSDRDNARRVISLVKSGHHSALGQAFANFKIDGVSRACANQIVRHAHGRYLQRSQRYVKETVPSYIVPPAVANEPEAFEVFHAAMQVAWDSYQKLLSLGIKKEDARYVLPMATKTAIVVAGNLQFWADFLFGKASRLDRSAQWEIRGVAEVIHSALREHAPNIFDPKLWGRP